MTILKNLKNRKYISIFGVAFILTFYTQYRLMADLPGSTNNMCEIGANLTPFNITFSIIFSILVALMVISMVALFKHKKSKNKAGISSLSGIAASFGILTSFCTICTLPVLSLFGLSFGLGFITEYQLLFQLLSIIMLASGLYLINKQLSDTCKICVVNK